MSAWHHHFFNEYHSVPVSLQIGRYPARSPVFCPLVLGRRLLGGLDLSGVQLRGHSDCDRSLADSGQAVCRLSDSPPRHFSQPLTFYLPPCLVSNGPALYYPGKAGPPALTFPFAGNPEQSFTNHDAKCKISKLLILRALMK